MLRRAGLALIAALLITPAAAHGAPLGLAGCGDNEGVLQCSGLVRTWDGVPLDTTVTLPARARRKLPLVVEIHGFGNSKHEYLDPESEAYTDNAYGWAKQGYAVLTYTARGLWGSCGTPESRAANPEACARGWIHLADTRYEVRDTQELVGRLVDEGYADGARIGVTGDSYGGGQTFALAALRDRVMLPDGRLVPWRSPAGTPLRIAAAAPVIPWTDLVYAVAPNGNTLSYTVTPPEQNVTPVGVFKTSFANGIFVAAQFAVGPGQPAGEPFVPGRPMGYVAPPGADPESDVTSWVARADAGEPYTDPQAQAIVDRLERFHSTYWIDDSRAPPPLFIGSGFTDDLFPVHEAVRFVNRMRRDHPRTPVALLLGDYGHQRASNKAAVRRQLVAAIHAWFDDHLRDAGTAPVGVTATTQTCPRDAPPGGPFRAPTFAALARGEVRYADDAPQVVISSGGDPATAAAIDPVSGGGDACAATPAATSPGTATYRLPPAPAAGYTLLGAPVVVARLRTDREPSVTQLAARLWDVAPDGRSQTLVTRALIRPSATGTEVFELHANGWHFAERHVPKLELLGADAPYGRPSNAAFRTEVQQLELRLPVREPPDCRAVQPQAAPVVPAGQSLAPGVAAAAAPGCGRGSGRVRRPRLRLRLQCTRAGVRATLSVDATRARRVDFYVRGRRVAADTRSPFSRIVARRTGRRFRVSARTALRGRPSVRTTRRAPRCPALADPRLTG